MIKVCLCGLGKTGKEIAKVLFDHKNIKVVAAVCSPSSSKNGEDVGTIIGIGLTGIKVGSSQYLMQMIQRTKPDVAIDFSTPDATLKNVETFARLGVNVLVGTTGFTNIGLRKLMLMAHKYHSGILYAPNITTGVNVLMLLTNLAASILSDYDFQITEVHHKLKKDIPSGTALKIAGEIEKGLKSSGIDFDAGNIPINAVRAGGIVGRHEVMLVSEFDKIEIIHESFSRKAFALGVLKGIAFLKGKTGAFEMSDVLDMQRVLKNYIEHDNNEDNKKALCYSFEICKGKEVNVE